MKQNFKNLLQTTKPLGVKRFNYGRNTFDLAIKLCKHIINTLHYSQTEFDDIKMRLIYRPDTQKPKPMILRDLRYSFQ